jgi:hypothetical protein
MGAVGPSAVTTEPELRRSRAVKDRIMEVAIKITAATEVTRLIIVAGPREPKTEPEDPPKAAPMPEFLPAWSKTLMIKIMATRIWTKITALNIRSCTQNIFAFKPKRLN